LWVGGGVGDFFFSFGRGAVRYVGGGLLGVGGSCVACFWCEIWFVHDKVYDVGTFRTYIHDWRRSLMGLRVKDLQ